MVKVALLRAATVAGPLMLPAVGAALPGKVPMFTVTSR